MNPNQPKTILTGLEALEKLAEGSEKLARIVGTTLGPRGRNIAIDRLYEAIVVHDGVTVAREVTDEDPTVNMGIKLIRQAANKQVEEVGDGTTVVTILANAILKEAVKVIAAGTNPMSLRRGLEEATIAVVKRLDELSIPIKKIEEKIQIATISAEDEELGKMIGETIHKIGSEGIITVEESKSAETYIEHQEGMQFEGGYISPYFVTNPARMEATVEETFILLTDKNVQNIHELLPLLETVGKFGSRNFVVIAPDVTDSALNSFIATKLNGGMNISAVKAPLFGQPQKDMLQDIAILTGGVVVSQDAGMKFESITLEMLGRAQRVTSTKDATLIVGGQGKKTEIDAQLDAIRSQLERNEGSSFQMEKLRERIAKLSGGVAIIKVGGHTEVEMKERKERAIDAVAATRAAVEEGIVPGGEIAYILARRSLGISTTDAILSKALALPFERLVENAGEDAGRTLLALENKWEGEKVITTGFDVNQSAFVDMKKTGIIDPVKVPKSAIRNAVSVAIQVMTSDGTIVPKPEEKKNEPNRR